MNQNIANILKEEFEGLTRIQVSATYMEKGATHNPTSLPSGMQGVYLFLAGEHCFKVGKAGAKSKAR